jgi:hypothetical protein
MLFQVDIFAWIPDPDVPNPLDWWTKRSPRRWPAAADFVDEIHASFIAATHGSLP